MQRMTSMHCFSAHGGGCCSTANRPRAPARGNGRRLHFAGLPGRGSRAPSLTLPGKVWQWSQSLGEARAPWCRCGRGAPPGARQARTSDPAAAPRGGGGNLKSRSESLYPSHYIRIIISKLLYPSHYIETGPRYDDSDISERVLAIMTRISANGSSLWWLGYQQTGPRYDVSDISKRVLAIMTRISANGSSL